MLIVGADYHPGFQQIAFVDMETGELQERRLTHREEAEKFYRELAARGVKLRVGMEASGHARWFERLLAELNFELWMGDAAAIRAKRVRKQRTDRQDACQVESAPAKQLVSVHSMRPRYSRYRYTGRQGLFNHPPLFRDTPPLPWEYDRAFALFGNDCSLLRSVHLPSKWTLLSGVHFARMALIHENVETVIIGRLHAGQ